jgi:hypothetical protein
MRSSGRRSCRRRRRFTGNMRRPISSRVGRRGARSAERPLFQAVYPPGGENRHGAHTDQGVPPLLVDLSAAWTSSNASVEARRAAREARCRRWIAPPSAPPGRPHRDRAAGHLHRGATARGIEVEFSDGPVVKEVPHSSRRSALERRVADKRRPVNARSRASSLECRALSKDVPPPSRPPRVPCERPTP